MNFKSIIKGILDLGIDISMYRHKNDNHMNVLIFVKTSEQANHIVKNVLKLEPPENWMEKHKGGKNAFYEGFAEGIRILFMFEREK